MTHSADVVAGERGPRGAADDLEVRMEDPFLSSAEAERAVEAALEGRGVPADEIDLEAADLPLLVRRLLATTREFERRMRNAEREAVLDPLTGLGNRRQWRTALRAAEERCRRGGGEAVVAVIDLDDFKAVNDLDGHAAGDAMLRKVAETLTEQVRAGDAVARTGGDEFAVLAFGTGDATTLAERLRKGLAQAGIGASVGAASRHSAGGLDEAWERADIGMYASKSRGRHRRIGRTEPPGGGASEQTGG